MTVTPQVVSAVTACGAQMLCGMSSGFTSPALPELRAELQLSVSQESLITALMPLGSALGQPAGGLGFCCGTLLEFVVGKYVSWRWLALLSAAVAAVWLPCLAVITESPLWLVMRRRPRAALDALQRLRAPQHDCKAELAELEHFARDVLRRRVRPREALRPPYIGPILIVAGLFFFQPASGNDALTWLPLAALITFNPAFAVGLGMVPWIIIGEMFAPEMRGWGASVGTTLTSLVTTLITVSFTGLAGAITQAGVFWLYSAITVLGVFFTLFCVLETKGKTLEEITEHFKGPDRRRPSGPVATEKEVEVDRASGQTARHRHSLSLDNGAPSGDTLCDQL
ncbi:Facilitated trehalose transporter Tret1 [Amphibalanus amphitrite]|uniref:Facilitated trehalose transporter Tret1 n=1 Tax=Amphibalanus amphitrite TaxID=1232801 RepID=A0A6A4WS69_AMPAM|nr:Facilitated trehalose transporter Tret1 [Amphibalanus amphitrite]